ncbi:lipopolysaccharide biosynthesis protein [Candidatus Omnitrophota bacterium]
MKTSDSTNNAKPQQIEKSSTGFFAGVDALGGGTAIAQGLKDYFQKSSFARNVATLMTGATIAQVIPVLVSPILTRLYLPEDFGVLALFIAICSFAGTIITGKYDSSIVLPNRDEDAVNILALCFIITITISVVALLIVVLSNNSIDHLVGMPELSKWLYFVPLSLFLIGVYQALSNWSCRKKQFMHLATRDVIQSSSTSTIKLGMGLVGAGFGGLIAGTLVGNALATAFLSRVVWKADKDKKKFLSKDLVIANAAKYSDFPKYNAPQAFLDGFRRGGLVFIITAFVGLNVLGYYTFAVAMILKPLRMIGNAVSQVFYQKAAEAYNSGEDVWHITRKLLLRLFLIGIPGFLFIAFFGPQAFSLVFGANWREAGSYGQLLIPWLFLQFITSPITTIPLILRKQKQYFIVSLGYNLLIPSIMAAALWLGAGFRNALILLALFASLYLIGMLLWIRRITISHSDGEKA